MYYLTGTIAIIKMFGSRTKIVVVGVKSLQGHRDRRGQRPTLILFRVNKSCNIKKEDVI